jgi:hypothetical protein
MGIYVVFGILVLLNSGISIRLIMKKQVSTAVMILIPTILSLLFFWLYADSNDYWRTVCDESNGCMNETGLIMAISLFFIYLATMIQILSIFIKMLKKAFKI